jgi:ABC-type transport system involved in multi-copper enzyme maturation permease subunit
LSGSNLKEQLNALIAEVSKNKHSKIIWITFAAFSLAPIFGGLFIYLMQSGTISGAIKAKAEFNTFQVNWESLLGLLSQAAGVGGIVVFGFAASWLFGREYSEGTVKDLLSLPISRTKILNAKFIFYFAWCSALILSNLILGLLIGFILQVPDWSMTLFAEIMRVYFLTALLAILADLPVAFFAITGKGYLVPLGIVIILVVLAQIIGALGLGIYFPWAIPGIYSGSGGESLKMLLDYFSFLIVLLTGIAGYVITILWWKYSDQIV